jgi:hypothetical protein
LAPVVHALDVVAETSGYANVVEMSGALSGCDSSDVSRHNSVKRRNSRKLQRLFFKIFLLVVEEKIIGVLGSISSTFYSFFCQ